MHAMNILFLLVGATAFSPSGRFSGIRRLLPSTTTHHQVACEATKDRHKEEANSYVNDVPIDEDKLSGSSNDNVHRSEIEQFVSAMRELYVDLENGGGSIRRKMNGVGFTYVSPVICSPGENRMLAGAWRRQKPINVGVGEDLTDIHRNIMKERFMKGQSSSTPPLLVYLPGLDGFGLSATAQFDDLSSSFEFWRMTIDKDSKLLSFSDLVVSVVNFVKEITTTGSSEPQREVILAGESFGGLLTCAVAMALKKGQSSKYILKGMVLINPATSFDETVWERVVPILTSLRYLESQEEATDDNGNSRFSFLNGLPTPYSVFGAVALAATVPSGMQYSSILDFLQQTVSSTSAEKMLSASVDGFGILAEYISPAILDQRVMKWIPVGTSVVNNPQRLSKLDVPTLIIGGRDDNLLPTKKEADRLGKLLPDCVVMDIAGAGHFVLDAGFNLTEVLIDSHIDPLNSKKAYDPISDWTLPPDHIVKAVIEKRVVPLRERTSPVFFSTDPVTGKRRRGLSHVPSTGNPLLFVANHQLFGYVGRIVREF
jgi:pimeloyl-ACP methyl ester carboxylesterase